MNKKQQKEFATRQKFLAQEKLKKQLFPWEKNIVRQYRIGDTSIPEESRGELALILRAFYYDTMDRVVRFDVLQNKQDDIPWYTRIIQAIAKGLSYFIGSRVSTQTAYICNTADKYIQTVTTGIQVDKWENPGVQLTNYFNNQRLTVAVMESEWAVETARAWVVRQVNDPLRDTLYTIADLISQNKYSEAIKLSKEVEKLALLPLSVSQGEALGILTDDRTRLMTPRTQGEIIATLRKKAESLGAGEKQWQALGDSKTRASHNQVNGQKRLIEEPFTLPGGLLQYPGDASLGASLGELIGCRCVSVYI